MSDASVRPFQTEIRANYELVIDHAVLEIPVDSDGIVVRPLATILIDTNAEAAVGLALSLDHPSPAGAAAAILDALRHGQRQANIPISRATRIAIPADGSHDWRPLTQTLVRANLVVETLPIAPRGGGKFVEQLFGRRKAGIEMRARLIRAPIDERRPKKLTAFPPMTLEEALSYARPRLIGSRATAAFAHLDDIARSHFDNELVQTIGR
jgi:hypothetical protein